LRILTNDDVAAILRMPECVATLEEAYRDLGNRDAADIPRQDLLVPTSHPGAVHAFKTMSGSWPRAGITALRLNSDIVSWPVKDGVQRRVKIPAANGRWVGLVLLFDSNSATPLAIFPDGVMQKTRVGGASGVAMKYLARKDSTVLALLGSGWQAEAQLEAACAVRAIDDVRVFSPTPANREEFASRYSKLLGINVQPVASPDEAVKGAHIIVSATNSLLPTLKPEWVRPGVHLTSVRGSEIPLGVILKIDRLAVNTREPVTAYPSRGEPSKVPEFENGDYSRPDMTVFDWSIVPELCDIVAGNAVGRESDEQSTCFHNFKGLGLQFAALGSLVIRSATENNVGLQLEETLFTETVHP
jgi:alanine dehydrogenase